MPSPCQHCGACCAAYRVSFSAGEADDFPDGHVPGGLIEPITSAMACMRGTAAQPPRCIALQGRIGETVSCAIYEQRPSVCRDFAPLAVLGRGDEACNEARRRHGLPPLDPPA